MAKPTRVERTRYELLHRFFAGITIVCFIVCVIAGALAGASTIVIVGRGLFVIAAVNFISWMLIKTWMAWETTRRG